MVCHLEGDEEKAKEVAAASDRKLREKIIDGVRETQRA